MAFLEPNTVENLIVLLAGVLLFNGLIYIPSVITIFQKYPLAIVGLAVVLILFKKKIAGSVGA